MQSATSRTRNTLCISCVSNQGCLQSNVCLMAFEEVQISVPAEELHTGRTSSITWECTQKASGSGPWLNQVQGKPPHCDIQTSIQHKAVFVPFMMFMQRQVQFIHFKVLWKQDPKWVILWCGTSAKNSQLVQADILRTCFSSIKISSDDLFLYNTGIKETLFSQRWLMGCPQDKCSSLEPLHQGCPLLQLHIFSRGF